MSDEQAALQEAFVIDTSFIQKIGREGIIREVEKSLNGNCYIPSLQQKIREKMAHVRGLSTRGKIICVPEVLRELQGTIQALPLQPIQEGEKSGSAPLEELAWTLGEFKTFIETEIANQIYYWYEEPCAWGWFKQTVYNAAKMPCVGEGKRKLGDLLQTDRQIITATILAGGNREVSCITNDRLLTEHLGVVIQKTIREIGAEELFPFPINGYALYSEEGSYYPKRKRPLYIPSHSFPLQHASVDKYTNSSPTEMTLSE